MSKHTPGPWSYEPEINRVFSEPTQKCVAAPHILGNPAVMADWPADARLIAAAPEMLEALKEARTDLMIAADNARHAAKTDARWDGVDEKLMARVRLIDAVIAKAEGRS